jgi:FAM183A and FAM183B related
MSKKQRPVSARVQNEVQKLIIHREMLTWNKRYEDFSGKYRINPITMTSITQKPTQVNPKLLGSREYIPTVYRDPIEEAFSSEYIKKAIYRDSMTPGEKFRGPQTSSQEIGWYSFAFKRPTSAINSSTKIMCKETVFAEEYLKTVGKSPFKVRSRN